MTIVLRFIKKNFLYSWRSTVLSIVLLIGAASASFSFIQWALVDSVWTGTSQDCRAASGACWAFINNKLNFILIGFYPQAEIWRPALSLLIFLVGFGYLTNYKKWNKYTPAIAILAVGIPFVFLLGGFAGIPYVPIKNWGGLILTIFLTFFGCLAAYPLGILLALGRRSKLPVVKSASVIYIELIRGVPLISLLFMASVMLPFILPPEWSLDKVTRALIAIILFTGAYMAEVIRGGLQAIPKGQYEAAEALGLSYWKYILLIILPQALKIVIPPTVGVFISMFLDTTLVIIISMYDLLGTAKASLTDGKWLGFSREIYVFLLIIYFVFCYAMALYSTNLEKKLNVKHR